MTLTLLPDLLVHDIIKSTTQTWEIYSYAQHPASPASPSSRDGSSSSGLEDEEYLTSGSVYPARLAGSTLRGQELVGEFLLQVKGLPQVTACMCIPQVNKAFRAVHTKIYVDWIPQQPRMKVRSIDLPFEDWVTHKELNCLDVEATEKWMIGRDLEHVWILEYRHITSHMEPDHWAIIPKHV